MFKVFTGSPASSDLQRGDILLSIQNRDAANLLHHEANDIIKYSGGSLQLIFRRYLLSCFRFDFKH